MSGFAPDPGWVTARRAGAARALRRAVSATGLTHTRPGFGWTVRPAPGSILASPHRAAWDPAPDYFHHWVRDAAIALRAVPLAIAADPDSTDFWHRAIADHIAFSAKISDPQRHGPTTNPLGPTTRPDHRRFLRPDAELAALTGAGWREEPRCAPDGEPDLERWDRPQDDGPALRASALMAVIAAIPDLDMPQARALITGDLAHVAAVAGRPCIGPWEEPPARRCTFTLIAQWDALERGSRWPGTPAPLAATLGATANRVADLVTHAADPQTGGWRESLEAGSGVLDAATVLAILQAGRSDGPFALSALATRATVAGLEVCFAALYPLNAGQTVPAIGRYAGDGFFGGNPWYPVTLGFAELHYRIAATAGDSAALAKAEAWMALIQQVAPQGDDLPEQFDRATGATLSCPALTWSAAAFLGAAAAREVALAR